jgi:hypothetical protein
MICIPLLEASLWLIKSRIDSRKSRPTIKQGMVVDIKVYKSRGLISKFSRLLLARLIQTIMSNGESPKRRMRRNLTSKLLILGCSGELDRRKDLMK